MRFILIRLRGARLERDALSERARGARGHMIALLGLLACLRFKNKI